MSSRPATAAPRRKAAPKSTLRLVRRKRSARRSKSRRFAPAIVCVAVIIAAVSVVLIEQVMLAQTAFKVAQMREQIVKAEARHAELVLQAAQLGSSERIERVARRDLNMVPPEEVHYVVANVRPKGPALAQKGPKPVLPADGHTAAMEGTTP